MIEAFPPGREEPPIGAPGPSSQISGASFADAAYRARRWLDTLPPIYPVALAVVAGDALGNLEVALPAFLGWAAGFAALACFVARRPLLGRAFAIAGILAAASLPALRLHQPRAGGSALRMLPDRALVTVEGRVLAPPELLPGATHLLVTVERAAPMPLRLARAVGLVRVTLLAPNDFRLGDEVRFTARIRFPYRLGDAGEFDYQAWLERQGIDATFVIPPHPRRQAIRRIGYQAMFPATQIEAIRDHIRRFFIRGLAWPESAEMRALVIGDRGGLGEVLRRRFALTGMAHLLVISGLHLSFIAAAAFALVRFILGGFPSMLETGRANRYAAVFAALAVAAYATIAGRHVSTTRALIMVLSYVLAVVVGRSREVMASLALAAIVICILLPGSSADVGFQLSFASVIAIVLGMRRFGRWTGVRLPSTARYGMARPWRERIALAIAGYLAVSFWALLGTAPLTAFYFNQFSTVGLIANAVVVPIMGLCGTVCGLLAAALSFVAIAPAHAMLALGGLMLQLATALAGWFLRWPYSWVRTFTPTVFELVLAYALIGFWLALPTVERRALLLERRSRIAGPYALVLAALLAAVALDAGWWTRDRYFNSALRVTFLSVGEGDAAVVRFPAGRVMLIDAGGSFTRGWDPGERIVAPFLWAHKIMHVDYLALSHPDLDHFGGFEFIVENFSPGQFWMSGQPRASPRFAALLAALAEHRVPFATLDAASPPLMIGGATLRCLAPAPGGGGRRNNASMVLRLSLGASSFLFAGDLEAAGERVVLAAQPDLRSTVLKVPHHGSATSSSAAFVDAVAPEFAVISLGYLNRYGFPASEVLARYQRIGAELIRTDQSGEIDIEASGTGIALHTFRPEPALPVDRSARAVGRWQFGKLLRDAAFHQSRRRVGFAEENAWLSRPRPRPIAVRAR